MTSTTLIIEGKTLEERITILETNLHTPGSAEQARKMFPDLDEIFVEDGSGSSFPSNILPFKYYYSEEAGKTISICNIGYTVFICDSLVDEKIDEDEYDNCRIAREYLQGS